MGKYTEIKTAIRERITLLNKALYVMKLARELRNILSDFKGKKYSETNFDKFFKYDKLDLTSDSFYLLKKCVTYARKLKTGAGFDDVIKANRFIEFVIKEDGISASFKKKGSTKEILESICVEYKERICKEIEEFVEGYDSKSIDELKAHYSHDIEVLEAIDKKIEDDRVIGKFNSEEFNVLYELIRDSDSIIDCLGAMFTLFEMISDENNNGNGDTSQATDEIVVQENDDDDDDENSIDVIKLLDSLKREFERIVKEFRNIGSYIYIIFEDAEQANAEAAEIRDAIDFIEKEYYPKLDSLKNDGNVPENTIDWFYERIVEYKNIIKEYRKKKSIHERSEEDIVHSEGTENLVFCMNDDIDLSDSDFQRGYIGAVKNLEAISVDVLCRLSSDNGLGRIKKSTESGRKEDFINYLENKYNIALHFVPYRYHSNANSRVGIIKFEPSIPVKEFLIKRYGISQSCAVFGIFEIISVVGANHNEYSILESYILKKFRKIEELASMFSSNTPDLKRLEEIIDNMLAAKAAKQAFAKTMLNGGQK